MSVAVIELLVQGHTTPSSADDEARRLVEVMVKEYDPPHTFEGYPYNALEHDREPVSGMPWVSRLGNTNSWRVRFHLEVGVIV